MRPTTVAIAFFFFGTVFATPIFPLDRNSVELVKRSDPPGEIPTTGDPSVGSPSEPKRGRARNRGGSVGSTRGRGGKVAQLKGESAAESSTSRSPKRKASDTEGEGSPSGAKKARCAPKLIKKADFLAALKKIDTSKPLGRGSRGFGVYAIEGEVTGCKAVVKIIIRDDIGPDDVKKISGEVAGLRQVEQLLGWGRLKNPDIDYILMRNMGVSLSATGLKDEAFITRKQNEALERYRTEYHLSHSDPKGHNNYLWYIDEKAAESDMDARYTVNVVDWADPIRIGPDGTKYAKAPTAITISATDGIFVPKGSPESSKKATTSPSGSDGEKKVEPAASFSKGDRSSKRLSNKAKGKTMEEATPSTDQE